MEQKPEAQAEKREQAASSSSSMREEVALTQGRGGIFGIKAGMTQVYSDEGDALAVTVIDLRPVVITQVKSQEKEGYNGVQVGIMERKPKRANRAEAGHAKKSNTNGFYEYREVRLPVGAKMDGVEVGKVLSVDFLKPGDLVDITAVSKGKGFQGVMKRHNFAGGPASHGASVVHRAPGSIGNRADPAKVFKNKKMAGHMGLERVTIQNIRVVSVDKENQLLLVHGSVPGPKTGIVTISRAVKSLNV